MPASHLDWTETHLVGAKTRERFVGRTAVPALAMAGIRFCGCSWALPGFRFVRPTPDFVQVLACRSGNGEVLANGRWSSLGPGRSYVTPAGSLHAYRATDAAVWELAWVMLDPVRLQMAMLAPAVVSQPVEGLALAIAGLCGETVGADQPTLREAWVRLVELETQRILTGTGNPLDDPALDRAFAAASQHLDRPWTVAGLAQLVGIGAEQFRRRCWRRHGRSPRTHLRLIRLDRVKDLEMRGVPRNMAAAMAGFASAAALRRTCPR